MTGRRGDDLLLLTLGRDGLRYLTGLAGEAFAELFEAARRHPEVVYIPAPDPPTVLAVADGLGRATGGPVVVNLRHAPAYPPTARREIPQPGLPAVVLTDRAASLPAKARLEPASPADLVEAVRVAARTAILPPAGPVQVAFGPDVLATQGPAEVPHLRRQYLPLAQPPDPEAVREAANLLLAAERPVLVAGPELVRYGAVDRAVALAERLALPVFLDPAPGPYPGFPTAHPACSGYPDLQNPAWAEADLVVVVGRLRPAGPADPLLKLTPAGARILAVSPWGPEWVTAHGRGLELLADPKSGLEALWDQVDLVEGRRKPGPAPPAGPSDPVIDAVLDYLGTEGVLLVDDPAVNVGRVRRPDPATLWPAPPGDRGWGVGAAVGAWLGLPTRRQVALVDDAGLVGGLGGLWTAARFRLPIRVVVRNRRAYPGIAAALARRGIKDLDATELTRLDGPAPDLKGLVEAFGARYIRTAAANLRPTLENTLGFDRPAVVDVDDLPPTAAG